MSLATARNIRRGVVGDVPTFNPILPAGPKVGSGRFGDAVARMHLANVTVVPSPRVTG
jgi:hypothetical protein